MELASFKLNEYKLNALCAVAHGLIRHANMLMSMHKWGLVANTVNVDRFHANATHWLETIKLIIESDFRYHSIFCCCEN